ncbi:MAG: tetratricopeptide repeat protein [Bacteroidota bacterium]
MKAIRVTKDSYGFRRLGRLMMVAFLLALIPTVGAQAQDDQEYKRVYNSAIEAAKAKQYAQAYELYTQAVQLAQTAGDQEIVDKSKGVLAQIDQAYATRALRQENFEQALEHSETGIANDPNRAANYYNRGLALKKMDRIDDAMAAFVETIEVAQANSDRRIANLATGAISDHYTYLAGAALNRNNNNPSRADANEALEALATIEQFEQVEAGYEVFYYRAVAQRALGQPQEALTSANQALEMFRGSKSDGAKIHFVIGEIQMEQGNMDAARVAFQEASYGQYKASAEHYLENVIGGR